MRIRVRVALLFVVFLLSSWAVCAQNDSRSRRDKLQREIAVLEGQLRSNAGKNADALASLSLVRKSIRSREELLRQSETQLAELNDSIRIRQAEADLLQKRLDTLGYYYGRLVRSAYRNRDSRVWYMYILASDNMGQAARRFRYLRSLSGRMNVQARQISETKERLDTELVQLNVLKAAAEQLTTERRADLQKLRGEEQHANNLVGQLNREKKKYQNQLTQKRKQVESLNREIERLIASEIGSGKSGKSKGRKVSSTVDTKLSGEFASNRGRLPWPCEGAVVESFGQRRHPVYTSITMPFNNGVNLAVSPGTSVMAIFDGVVKKVIIMPGYNKCVLVQHGDYFSFYCKLGSVSVKAGDKVRRGQALGVVDTIEGQTQLHLQIWQGSRPQDPELWLKKD